MKEDKKQSIPKKYKNSKRIIINSYMKMNWTTWKKQKSFPEKYNLLKLNQEETKKFEQNYHQQ